MEFKIWKKTDSQKYRLIRYMAIFVLPILLAFYILRFQALNRYLVTLNPGHIIPAALWVAITKFFSYCLHIAINFCILWAITNRLKYSLCMVYVAFAVLLLGTLLVFFKEDFGVPVPLTVVAFFVKINKSFLLLVLFIAGHFIRRNQPTS